MRKILLGALCGSLLLAADVGHGVELYKQSKFAEAERELRAAVAGNEEDAQAHRYLGLALVEQKKFDEATEQLNRALELDPGGESKAAMARLYVEKQELDKAESMLEGAKGPEASYAKGVIEVNRKQFAEAAPDLEAFIDGHPDHAYAHYYAGLAYNGIKRKDKMLSHFEIFLRLAPDAPEARKVRAVLQTGR